MKELFAVDVLKIRTILSFNATFLCEHASNKRLKLPFLFPQF